jgi:hypothetical protein
VRFLGFYTFEVLLSKLTMHCHCVYLKQINVSKNIFTEKSCQEPTI